MKQPHLPHYLRTVCFTKIRGHMNIRQNIPLTDSKDSNTQLLNRIRFFFKCWKQVNTCLLCMFFHANSIQNAFICIIIIIHIIIMKAKSKPQDAILMAPQLLYAKTDNINIKNVSKMPLLPATAKHTCLEMNFDHFKHHQKFLIVKHVMTHGSSTPAVCN